MNGAAAKPTGRCCAPCPRVLRQSVWTPCTSLTSAAPSAKTVREANVERGAASPMPPGGSPQVHGLLRGG